MAKPNLILHFHGDESFGTVLERACAASGSEALKSAAPFPKPSSARTLPALLRLANSLGQPILLSLSNERLARALADGAERKALADGVSRHRFLPTPAAAFGAELRLLAPFETADELRLNLDLWRLATITPPFSPSPTPASAAWTHVFSEDPAATLAGIAQLRSGQSGGVLGVDLASIEAGADPEAALARLTEHLRARTDARIVGAVQGPRNYAEHLLGGLLSSGARYRGFTPDKCGEFDLGRDGFPLDLARSLADLAAMPRQLAALGPALASAGFDVARLEPAAARGLLLRRLARAGSPDAVARLERKRANFAIALALLERLAADPQAIAGTVPAAAFEQVAEVVNGLERDVADAATTPQTERYKAAKKLLTKARGQMPQGSEPAARPAFVAALLKLTTTVFLAIEKLVHGAAQAEPSPATATSA